MDKIKKFGYGKIALILLVVYIIYTVAVPTNTRTSLIRGVLLIAFICSLILWIYQSITSKKNKTENVNQESKPAIKDENSEEKTEEQSENEPNKKGNGFKEWFQNIIDSILGIKKGVWATILGIIGLIALCTVSTPGYVICFVSWTIGTLILLDKRGKGSEVVTRNSEKISGEIAESIKNGTYPDIKVEIPTDEDEKVYGVYNASMIKEKTVRSTTSFGGPTASIKIMKGVRYRVGSITHQTESSKAAYNYDYGKLYVTTKRFIYVGDKETDTIKAKEIMKLLVVGDSVYIYKQKGKPARYQLSGDVDTFIGVMKGLNHM